MRYYLGQKGRCINGGINAVDHWKCLYEAHIKVFINGLNKAIYKCPKCLYEVHIKVFINGLNKAIYKRPKCLYEAHIKVFINGLNKAVYKRPKLAIS